MTSEKQLLEQLRRVMGEGRVLSDPDKLEEVCWDALGDSRIHPRKRPPVELPLCALLPRSTAEVREAVLLANREKVPIVPFGGGSGLMGGALSIRRGIVLDLRQMDRITAIDKRSFTATAQAGVVLEDLEKALNRQGLILGHDPWTLPVATVGGAISTNSLGYRGARYGSMGDQVLGLEVVLPMGEILRTRAVPKSSTGISLKHLFIGAEGCLGVITEATVRVFPAPEKRALFGFSFSSFEQGYGAIEKIFARGIVPAVVDFGDDTVKFEGRAVLYLGFEGVGEVVDAESKIAVGICREAGAVELPRADAEYFWNDRHVIARQFKSSRRRRRERSGDFIKRDWIHVALPASEVLAFRRAAMKIVPEHDIRLQESGLWNRPELFSMRLAVEDSGDGQGQERLQETVEELLRLVQKMGGSMEYTHGVGIKLASLMAEEHGYGLEVMRRIKRSLDPNNIMNPGKLGL
ncbi:MAG TPA: FAD-binding oxidoreductase [Candidatus Acidoferrales bacterium]|nr:FAD-binding oxidoreductase [Candidatus Acidoferrales bacterium]